MIYSSKDIDTVISNIDKDDVIVFPTDTVYGIGASISSRKALSDIFKIKNRPDDKSLIVLCANTSQIEEIVGPLSEHVQKLVTAFLPGGLTLILNHIITLPEEVTRGKQTIGIRIPNHPDALKLIEALGPLATTSANVSGEPSPTEIDLQNPVVQKVPFVVDAGPTKEKIPSTILDCTVQPPVILRSGAISEEKILKVLDNGPDQFFTAKKH